MKTLPVLLAATLLGNLVLASLLWQSARQDAFSSSAASAAASKSSANAARTRSREGVAQPQAIDPKLWENLSPQDYDRLVAKLREQGFPPSVVRSILAAQVDEDFKVRRQALQSPKTPTPFWQLEPPANRSTLAAQRDLSRERNKLMKELLGPNLPDTEDPTYAVYLKRQFGDLPTDKVDLIRKVQQDYSELRSDLYSAAGMGGGMLTLTPDDRAKLALLEKEQRADLQQIMTPAEFQDYELRSSTTANSMRFQLTAFAPSEQEFRTIFPLQRAFDEQYRNGPGDIPSQDAMRQRGEAQKQLTAQIKAELGPERGAEYERSIDGNFRQISSVVERLELPKDAAVQVWTTQKDIELRTAALRMDQTLPPEARTAQLAALATEAKSKVSAALGERGYEIYKQYGGYWLQNLQPRPVPPPPGAGGGGTGTISPANSVIVLPAR